MKRVSFIKILSMATVLVLCSHIFAIATDREGSITNPGRISVPNSGSSASDTFSVRYREGDSVTVDVTIPEMAQCANGLSISDFDRRTGHNNRIMPEAWEVKLEKAGGSTNISWDDTSKTLRSNQTTTTFGGTVGTVSSPKDSYGIKITIKFKGFLTKEANTKPTSYTIAGTTKNTDNWTKQYDPDGPLEGYELSFAGGSGNESPVLVETHTRYIGLTNGQATTPSPTPTSTRTTAPNPTMTPTPPSPPPPDNAPGPWGGPYDEGETIPRNQVDVGYTTDSGSSRYIDASSISLSYKTGNGSRVSMDPPTMNGTMLGFGGSVVDVVGGIDKVENLIVSYKEIEKSRTESQPIDTPGYPSITETYTGTPTQGTNVFRGPEIIGYDADNNPIYQSHYQNYIIYYNIEHPMTQNFGYIALKRFVQRVTVEPITLFKDTPRREGAITYEVTPTDAYDRSVAFTSDNTSVATIDQNRGWVTAQDAGSITITATTRGTDKSGATKSATGNIYVYDFLDPNTVDILYFNDTIGQSTAIERSLNKKGAVEDPSKLTFTIEPTDDFDFAVENDTMKFTNINKSVENKEYTITAHYSGKISGELQKKTNITLRRVVDAFALDEEKPITMFKDNTYTLTARLRPDTVYNSDVNWSSSSSSVAVSPLSEMTGSGEIVYKARITGASVGSSNIKAETVALDIDGNTKSDDVTVNVMDISVRRPSDRTRDGSDIFIGPGGTIYYKDGSTANIYIDIDAPSGITLSASDFTYTLPSNDHFDSSLQDNGTNKLKIVLNNFRGNSNQAYELGLSYTKNGYPTFTTYETINLDLKRVVDLIKMPNEVTSTRAELNPLVVFKGDTIHVKSQLAPVDDFSRSPRKTIAYNPYVTWRKSTDSNISIPSNYTVVGDTVGETLGTNYYISALPVTGLNVGSSTVYAKADGINIQGNYIENSAGVYVIDVANLPSFDLILNKKSKDQAQISKVVDVTGTLNATNGYRWSQIQANVAPINEDDNQYLNCVTDISEQGKIYVRLTPKDVELLKPKTVRIRLTVSYTNTDDFTTISTTTREADVRLYPFARTQ